MPSHAAIVARVEIVERGLSGRSEAELRALVESSIDWLTWARDGGWLDSGRCTSAAIRCEIAAAPDDPSWPVPPRSCVAPPPPRDACELAAQAVAVVALTRDALEAEVESPAPLAALRAAIAEIGGGAPDDRCGSGERDLVLRAAVQHWAELEHLGASHGAEPACEVATLTGPVAIDPRWHASVVIEGDRAAVELVPTWSRCASDAMIVGITLARTGGGWRVVDQSIGWAEVAVAAGCARR